ncbi:hypothetical protein COX95_03550 [bacterium CG_4_10_14_0_2_um_filter_33_32]|nr:MAG: hypothetical protein AUJ93_04745 [bacterium CG2_30_33_46]PIR67513.1 MAG: hypothetical protein COU50_02680 [bacterium CG10_big_fil_rev_8_21_14_0_10_33_18]PIU76267.1 MAG: hypothetical protein COS74_04930 [bacterium CG06_land_8_20_14_3_00_33_50]PIW81539.1 MAG: hypothetical protein COZ97_01235 [bacterium CG_4_8_14_3_um_filter_33_28]PIY85778.1 MAG: hypothetical protein COY76_00420 [bacterium CG_4_10_14_0_8_um_filter_33_57]PIZ85638.1 MAG: hypothetical protein COX95_03550 [bacterium CG_4_10_1
MKKYIIAIDMGGTHIRTAIFDKDSRILSLESFHNSHSIVDIKKIKDSIRAQSNNLAIDINRDVDGIGIAIASPGVNPATGKVNWNKLTFTFPKNFNILNEFRKEFKKPVFIENDLNSAALAELYVGNLQGKKNGLVITVSTGIGAGIISNGFLLRGSNYTAGEIGHMFINDNDKELVCNRGDFGCWEAFASAKSTEQRYYKKYKKQISAKEIIKLAQKGNKKALSVLKDISFWFGLGLSNIINILDPEVIVMYGNFFLNSWPLFKKDVLKIIQKRSFNPSIKFKRTKFGDNGSLIGAANLVIHKPYETIV